ncbi:hypothetical protein K1719_045383 [Acacia pycnantha]|nr:hypothetical protein K1719_045383 [Acacia pycnantha]
MLSSKPIPKWDMKSYQCSAIQYAGGLPLALQVLGSYLNSRDTKTWDSALKKFRKHPNVEVQNVLRVSFDGLDIPEKRIFLDIAFFFRGEKKEDIIRMLDACDDFYTDCGIDNLIDKTLITISRGNTVEIHDLLQEMAEDIVRNESIGDPGRRSRLNDAKEIQDVLENNKGTDAIEGITLKCEILVLSAKSFQEMSNLRFLKIQSGYDYSRVRRAAIYFPHGLNSLSNKLRYFYWDDYPLEALPLGFCPEKLVEIHLLRSAIKKLWNGVQDLMNLKIIKLCFSEMLEELPDFSKACNLETVDLTGCSNLRSIHPSILSLPKLVSLDLNNCYKLKNLHGENHLKSLKHLMLYHCTRLKEFLLSSEEMRSLDLSSTGIKTLNLPVGRFNKLEDLTLGRPLENFQVNELSCLKSLKKFSLSHFRGVLEKSKLHILFDAWPSLEELHLTHCEVPEIPENISGLSLLKILSLRRCNIESLPHSIKHLSELKQIDLGKCRWLRTLPELPSSITHFCVSECTSLETMDFTLMRAIYNNAGEVKVCYPGSTIPKGFKYSQTGKNSITIELAAPSSSDHLLGFVCCCILSRNDLFGCFPSRELAICRKFHFEDDGINYKDEKKFPHLWKMQRDHVFVCSTNGIKAGDGNRNRDARIIQHHRDARITQRYSKIEELELDAQLFEKRLRVERNAVPTNFLWANCGNSLLPSASSTSSCRSKLVNWLDLIFVSFEKRDKNCQVASGGTKHLNLASISHLSLSLSSSFILHRSRDI